MYPYISIQIGTLEGYRSVIEQLVDRHGLVHSRVFLLCILLTTFGSSVWAQEVFDSSYGELQNRSVDFSGFLNKDPKFIEYIDERVHAQMPAVGGVEEKDVVKGSAIKMGLLDSGINPDHPQLTYHDLKLASFTNEPPEDSLGHGTAVAILMTLGDPVILYSARVTDVKHRVLVDAFVEAMAWMTKNKVRVVNTSLAFDPNLINEEKICKAVLEFPGLVVASAGNRGVDWRPLPANCQSTNVLNVTNEEKDSGAGDIAAPIPDIVGYTKYVLIRGFSHLKNMRFELAIQILLDLVEQEEPGELALYYSAYAHFSLEQLQQASTYTQILIERENVEVHVLWLDALIRANLGQRKESASSLERLLLLDSDNDHAGELLDWIENPDNLLPDSLANFFKKLDE